MARSTFIDVTIKNLDKHYEQDILDARAQYQRAKLMFFPVIIGIPILMWIILPQLLSIAIGLFSGLIVGFVILLHGRFSLEDAEDKSRHRDLEHDYL